MDRRVRMSYGATTERVRGRERGDRHMGGRIRVE